MAASITGTFTIIDRASGPMRKMERQAKQTMAAIEGVGIAQDHAGSRGSSGARGMEDYERQMRNVGRGARDVTNDLGGTERQMRKTESSSRSLTQRIKSLGGVLIALRVILRTLFVAGIVVAVTSLVQAVGALAGGFAALLPVAASAAGALAGIPAAAAAAAQGIGTLKLAMGGLGAALKAGTQLSQQSGAQTMQMAMQHKQAVLGVQSAEHNLMIANRSAKEAQIQLTMARRDARRELIDLTMAAQGADLAQRRAAISLAEARRNLTQTEQNPQSTGLDVKSARLGVQEAAFALRQSRIDRQRAQADNARAQKKGVEGNQQVRSARNALSDAIYGQTQATQALATAQEQANYEMRYGNQNATQYAQALSQLSPQAQDFVKHLIAMRPVLKGLRAAAGQDLFPGLTRALDTSQALVPTLQRNLRRTGGVIGNQAAGFAQDMTTPGRIADVNGLMANNAHLLNQAGRGFRNLASALLDFMTASRPFTNWMSHTILGWTDQIRQQQQFRRESGATAASQVRTRQALTVMGHILRNLYGAWKGFKDAAWDASMSLWQGIEGITARWNAYTNSIQGSAKIKYWLGQLRAPLHELGGLTHDLLSAWAHVTVDPAFTQTIVELRKAVPFLERFLQGASGMGPAAARFLGQLLRLLANLPFSPLTMFLDALTGLLKIVNALIERIPGLGIVLSGLITVALIGKLGKYLMKIKLVEKGWVLVRNAIKDTAVAQAALDMLPGGGPGLPGRGGPGLPGRGGPGLPGLPGRGGGKAGGSIFKRVWNKVRGRGSVGGEWADLERFGEDAAGAGLLARGRGLLGRGRGALGRLFGRGAATGEWEQLAEQGAARGGMLSRLGGFGRGALGRIGGIGRGALSGGKMAVGGRLLGGVGVASLIAQATGVENMDPLLFLEHGKSGVDPKALTGEMKSISDRSIQAGLAGNVHEVTRLRQELKLSQDEADGNTQAFKQLYAQLDRAGVVAQQIRDSGIAKSWAGHFATMNKITRTDVRKIMGQLAKLPPSARRDTMNQLIAMTATLEREGLVPVGATKRLRSKLEHGLDGLDKAAARRVRKMVRAIGSELLAAIPTLKPLWDAVRNGTDPRKTGLSRRELVRRVLNFGSTNPNAPGLGSQFLGQGGREARVLPMTPAQLRRWQKIAGITPDAQIGPQTRAAQQRAGIIIRLVQNTNKKVQDSHKQTKKVVSDANGDIADNTQKQMSTAADSAGKQARRANSEASNAFSNMRDNTLRMLQSMGMTRPQAVNALHGRSSTTKANPSLAPGSNGQIRPTARGGRIPGTGLRDSVMVTPHDIAAPGELIVNRHTERRQNAINRAIGAPPLGKLVDGETRPHYMAMGGRIGNIWGGHPALSGGIGKAVAAVLHKFPSLAVTSTTDHSTTTTNGGVSWHVKGKAADVSGAPDVMHAAAEWIKRAFGGSLEEGIHNPNLSIKHGHAVPSSFWGATTWGQHINHIHMAIVDALRMLGGVAVGGGLTGSVHAPRSRLAGAPGAMSNLAARAVARRMNHILGASGDTGGGNIPNFTGPWVKVMGQIARAKGWNLDDWRWLVNAESGGQPSIVNKSSGAFGLGQFLGATGRAYAKFGALSRNPTKQIQAMAHYIADRYHNPSAAKRFHLAHNWYAQGGRVPDWGGWNSRGGRFRVNRPTVFGAGENGSEDVTIRPAGGGGGGARPVVVQIDKIENHREGDVKKHIKREFELLRDDLDLVGAGDD